jgi:hypothetical protein
VTLLSGFVGADQRRNRTRVGQIVLRTTASLHGSDFFGEASGLQKTTPLELDMINETETRALKVPFGQLERSLINDFVRARGYDPNTLVDLPEDDREKLLADACIYASMKLVEVEARSHFLDKIHDGTAGSV